MNALKKLLLLLSLAGVSACNSVLDDYMLGKDNSHPPKVLKEFKPSVYLVRDWTLPTGGGKQTNAYRKINLEYQNDMLISTADSGELRAYSPGGRLIWVSALPGGVGAGPTISNGRLYYTNDRAEVVALDIAHGKLLWKAAMSSDGLSKPLVMGERVVVKAIDGNVYSFDAKTGKKIWREEHGAPSLVLKGSSSPVRYRSGEILAAFSDGRLDTLSEQDGHVISQRSLLYANGSSDVERLIDVVADPILVRDDVIIASYQGIIGRWSPEEGQFVWKRPASVYKNMTLRNGVVYVSDSDDILWAISASSGKVLWKQSGLKYRNITEPTVVNGRIYLGDMIGYLHILDAHSGLFVGRMDVTMPIRTKPLVVGSKVFVQSNSGKISSFKEKV